MNKRHTKILDIIHSEIINTQDELVNRLKEEGFDVTQATVSRDISTLGLTKRSQKRGYAQRAPVVSEEQIRYAKLFKEGVISVEIAGNMLVIKTISGAGASAGAMLDSLKYPEILGSVAGDDTIIAVAKDEISSRRIRESLRLMMQ